MYLVDNFHSLTGVDVFSGRKAFDVDTLQIVYPKRNSKDTGIMKIAIKLKTRQYFKFYEKPVIIGYPITLPKDALIYFINDLIDHKYLNQKPEEVFSYVFPAQLQNWGSFNQTLLKGFYEDDFKSLAELMNLKNATMPEKIFLFS